MHHTDVDQPNRFCIDCKHLNRSIFSVSVDSMECLKHPNIRPSFISPVTGEVIPERRITNLCCYERALGFCQDGKLFEEKL